MSERMPEIVVSDTKAMDFEEVRRGRVHMIRRKRLPLETGIDGITMEYSLSVVPDGYFTPRHRHNFDQIRYTLSADGKTVDVVDDDPQHKTKTTFVMDKQ